MAKARGKAMKLLFIDELSVQIVADRFGTKVYDAYADVAKVLS